MFIPTDYILKVNVLSYNINTGRIFFIKDFWDQYSNQLIKDFYNETGLALEDKTKFFFDVKRSLFEYYYYTILKKTTMEISLYQQLTNIFQKYSGNGLPKLVRDFSKDVPHTYEEAIVEDPVDLTFTSKSHKRDSASVSIVSISEQLQVIESTSARSTELDFSMMEEFDMYLKQYMCEEESFALLKNDYEYGLLDDYLDQFSYTITFDDLINICLRIYHHYDKRIGVPTILNSLCFSDTCSLQSRLALNSRFDLWNKNFNHFQIYRSLTNYIGLDICDFLFTKFLKSARCYYKNGYEYVFCSFLIRDLKTRIDLINQQPHVNSFIKVADKVRQNQKKNDNIFNNKERSFKLSESVKPKSERKNSHFEDIVPISNRLTNHNSDSDNEVDAPKDKNFGFNFGSISVFDRKHKGL